MLLEDPECARMRHVTQWRHFKVMMASLVFERVAILVLSFLQVDQYRVREIELSQMGITSEVRILCAS